MSAPGSTSTAARGGGIPTVVLGGTGYVAGELLRLIAGHPHLELAAVMSDGSPGEPLSGAFPHLASAYPETRFCTMAELTRLLAQTPAAAVFSAAPHGVSAGLVDSVLTSAARAGTRTRVVDLSADFRYPTAEAYAAVYGHAHGAAARLTEFTCAVPEHLAELTTAHVGHPGCFATAVLLACVPLLALGLVEPALYVSGVTGSTGSGRKPVEGTHHPLRHSDLYSYNPLAHRHAPEIVACARAATGVETDLAFVPHSGPFARGIHVTVQARLTRALDGAAARAALREYYARAPFVRVAERAPHVKEVAASNYAHLSAAASGRTVAVMCALDNLTKGAAGGGMQWMNRMLGLAQTAGLTQPAPGWT
jgi:N-acetyl-gamma-glutamyl-phosphate reductase common form